MSWGCDNFPLSYIFRGNLDPRFPVKIPNKTKTRLKSNTIVGQRFFAPKDFCQKKVWVKSKFWVPKKFPLWKNFESTQIVGKRKNFKVQKNFDFEKESSKKFRVQQILGSTFFLGPMKNVGRKNFGS